MNIRAKHIPFEELADLADERATRDPRAELTEHLSACVECAGELTRLKDVLTSMRADKSVDAPRDVLLNVINLFPRDVKTSVVRRLLAVLTFDSVTSTPAFGTRSGLSDSRQLIYSTEGADIDLHLSTNDNRWTITGQLLGQPECGKGNVLLENDDYELSVALNDWCEFKVADVPPGEYRLRVRLTDLEVEVPRLALHQ